MRLPQNHQEQDVLLNGSEAFYVAVRSFFLV